MVAAPERESTAAVGQASTTCPGGSRSRALRLGPEREQLAAVLAQPVAIAREARTTRRDERPEPRRVVRLAQVAELVHDDVVEHRGRREREAPVEGEGAAR